jgi:hypothetical protein
MMRLCSPAGRELAYFVFDLPETIKNNNAGVTATVGFEYGPNHERVNVMFQSQYLGGISITCTEGCRMPVRRAPQGSVANAFDSAVTFSNGVVLGSVYVKRKWLEPGVTPAARVTEQECLFEACPISRVPFRHLCAPNSNAY